MQFLIQVNARGRGRGRVTIGGAMIRRRSHSVDAGIPPAILVSRVSFSRMVRSTILLPNHFRRLIPQFEFARACARNHPSALPAHISPSNQAEMDVRSSDLSVISLSSSSCCDISPAPLLLPWVIFLSPSLTHCSLSRVRSSLENMYRVALGA